MFFTEEKITIAILDWLESSGWNVMSFDYPQSGTGVALKPNNSSSEKNIGSIIPDIIAEKFGTVVFFENKNRYFESDISKINNIKNYGMYSESIARYLKNTNYKYLYYGIGLPVTNRNRGKVDKSKSIVDFIVNYDDGSISVYYQSRSIFL